MFRCRCYVSQAVFRTKKSMFIDVRAYGTVRKNPRACDVLRDFSHAIKREWTVITSENTDIDSDPAFSPGCDKGMPIAYM